MVAEVQSREELRDRWHEAHTPPPNDPTPVEEMQNRIVERVFGTENNGQPVVEPIADAPVDREQAERLRSMGDDFDIGKFIGTVSGNPYLDVTYRRLWLRKRYPDAAVTTTLIEYRTFDQDGGKPNKNDFALFKARVTCSDGTVGEGYGSETREDFKDYIEKAETKAVGRALENAGFGTVEALLAAGRNVNVRGGQAPRPQNQRPQQVARPVQQAQPQAPRPQVAQQQPLDGVPDASGGDISDLVGRIRAGEFEPATWGPFYAEQQKTLGRDDLKLLRTAWSELMAAK